MRSREELTPHEVLNVDADSMSRASSDSLNLKAGLNVDIQDDLLGDLGTSPDEPDSMFTQEMALNDSLEEPLGAMTANSDRSSHASKPTTEITADSSKILGSAGLKGKSTVDVRRKVLDNNDSTYYP